MIKNNNHKNLKIQHIRKEQRKIVLKNNTEEIMESYTTDDSNIETVDMSAVCKKTRKIDISLFLKLSDEYEMISNIYKVTGQALSGAIDQMTKAIGLDTINFKLASSQKLENLLMCSHGSLPPLPITGSDDEYSYTIIANVHSNDSHGNSPEISATIYRMVNNNPMDGFWVYDFRLMDWMIISYANHLGYTQKQFDILQNKSDSDAAILLRVIKTNKKILPDSAFEELYKKNKKILDLYRKTDLFMSLDFDQEAQETFLAPLKSDAVDGLSVTFHNGTYELNAVAHEQIIETILKTESEKEIQSVLTNMLDRKFYPDSVAIVPLSSNSLIDVRRNGNYEYLSNNTSIPAEEERIFQKYLCCYNTTEKSKNRKGKYDERK